VKKLKPIPDVALTIDDGRREILLKAIAEEEARSLGLQSTFVAQDLVGHSIRLQVRGETDRFRLRIRGIEALLEFKPEGVTQTVLAVQMVGVHKAIVEFLSPATAPGQTVEVNDSNVVRAARLMRLFNEQCEVMQRLKGQHAQQKIVVERVEVHDGGKAMVGAITAGTPTGGGGHDETK